MKYSPKEVFFMISVASGEVAILTDHKVFSISLYSKSGEEIDQIDMLESRKALTRRPEPPKTVA